MESSLALVHVARMCVPYSIGGQIDVEMSMCAVILTGVVLYRVAH